MSSSKRTRTGEVVGRDLQADALVSVYSQKQGDSFTQLVACLSLGILQVLPGTLGSLKLERKTGNR
jgi:hypothetical protein